MSIGVPTESQILIAGAGISAAAIALRLLDLNLRPVLIFLDRGLSPGMESIPDAAFPLLAQLHLKEVVHASGGEFVDGFENGWEQNPPIVRPGRWLHVERSRFAAAAVDEAVRRGAKFLKAKTLPELSSVEPQYAALVDASGRAAAWSRPIRRRGNQVADLYEIETPVSRARIVKLENGWAYRIGGAGRATVGIVSPHAPERRKLDESIRRRLEIEKCEARFIGRRPAFPQWCEAPVYGRRISIGDAALAYDPISGQGIRFALASAFAAAPVIRTWVEQGESDAGVRFYENFVTQARIRHLEFLEDSPLQRAPEEPLPLPAVVVFSGRRGKAELSVNSRIVVDDAILLANNSAVRWVGGLDLLMIEEFARTPVAVSALVDRLAHGQMTRERAVAVVRWCLRKNVLTTDES